MMKKNGFTLAEVLITLAIIGVVATMTLPALMTNTGEQQAKTGLKKGINTLTEAVTMNESVAGFDYGNITVTPPSDATGFTDENAAKQSLYGILANNCAIDYSKTIKIHNLEGSGTGDDTFDTTVYFRDGSALLYNAADATMDETKAKKQKDSLPLGFTVVYDTNGAKGPNVLSNCEGISLGKMEVEETQFTKEITAAYPNDAGYKDLTKCNDKALRVIKDQFTVRLRGNTVQPAGRAALWALAN